jgi:hypothetical protein
VDAIASVKGCFGEGFNLFDITPTDPDGRLDDQYCDAKIDCVEGFFCNHGPSSHYENNNETAVELSNAVTTNEGRCAPCADGLHCHSLGLDLASVAGCLSRCGGLRPTPSFPH